MGTNAFSPFAAALRFLSGGGEASADAWPRAAMAEKHRSPGKRGWVPASISRIASATGSLVAAAAGSVSRCDAV